MITREEQLQLEYILNYDQISQDPIHTNKCLFLLSVIAKHMRGINDISTDEYKDILTDQFIHKLYDDVYVLCIIYITNIPFCNLKVRFTVNEHSPTFNASFVDFINGFYPEFTLDQLDIDINTINDMNFPI